MQHLVKKFHIHKLDDWYDVPKTHLRLYGDAYNLWNTYPQLLITFSPLSNLSCLPLHKSNLSCLAFHLICVRYPTIEALVTAFYPTHLWDHTKFKKHSTKTLSAEIFMRRILYTIFPNARMEFNSRSHGVIGDSGIPLEIDVYIPTLRIGFEYQVSKQFMLVLNFILTFH